MLPGLELLDFISKIISLHLMNLFPLPRYTCRDLPGWYLAAGCRNASDWGQRAPTVEWVTEMQSPSLRVSETGLDELSALNPGLTLL